MSNQQTLNTCDHGHDTTEEVRVLPISENGGNAIICRAHYHEEMRFRLYRNRELEDFAKFDLPRWEDLKVYNSE
jgi:hypothetical protein